MTVQLNLRAVLVILILLGCDKKPSTSQTYTGYDLSGQPASCTVDTSIKPPCTLDLEMPNDGFPKACQDAGHTSYSCGCHSSICSAKMDLASWASQTIIQPAPQPSSETQTQQLALLAGRWQSACFAQASLWQKITLTISDASLDATQNSFQNKDCLSPDGQTTSAKSSLTMATNDLLRNVDGHLGVLIAAAQNSSTPNSPPSSSPLQTNTNTYYLFAMPDAEHLVLAQAKDLPIQGTVYQTCPDGTISNGKFCTVDDLSKLPQYLFTKL